MQMAFVLPDASNKANDMLSKMTCTITGFILLVVYAVASIYYTYGKPHTIALSLYVPWPFWACFLLGAVLFGFGTLTDKWK